MLLIEIFHLQMISYLFSFWKDSKMCIRDSYNAVRDLLTYYDAEQTAFSIINQYVRFVEDVYKRQACSA